MKQNGEYMFKNKKIRPFIRSIIMWPLYLAVILIIMNIYVYFLDTNAGRVVTKDELLKNVWEDEYIGEGTLAVHIRHLREKIEKDPKEPKIIKTIWGVGYLIENEKLH